MHSDEEQRANLTSFVLTSFFHSPITISHMSGWRVRLFGLAELASDWYGCALLGYFENPLPSVVPT